MREAERRASLTCGKALAHVQRVVKKSLSHVKVPLPSLPTKLGMQAPRSPGPLNPSLEEAQSSAEPRRSKRRDKESPRGMVGIDFSSSQAEPEWDIQGESD